MGKTSWVLIGIAAVVAYFWWKNKTKTAATAPVTTTANTTEAQVSALLQADAPIG